MSFDPALKYCGPFPSERQSLSAASLIPKYLDAWRGVSVFNCSVKCLAPLWTLQSFLSATKRE